MHKGSIISLSDYNIIIEFSLKRFVISVIVLYSVNRV